MLPLPQQKALAIIPKILSVPSWLGSTFIVQHVLRSPKRRKRVYHRILLLMCCMDWIFSIWTFISTWPIPADTPGVFGARGTTGTCTAAGFIGHGAGLSSIVFNGSLTLFFLLTVRFGWSEERTKRRIEPWVHIVPLSIGWGTAIAGLPLLLYNSFGLNCWIAPYPFGCKDSSRYGEEATCTRGDNAWIYRWAFYHGFLWAVYSFTLVSMFIMYRTLLKQERSLDKYRVGDGGFSNSRSDRRRRLFSTRFGHQALFFSAVFCLTWIWSLAQWIVQQRQNAPYAPLLYLQAIFVPSQGFLDALVYIRPRFLRFRERHPDLNCCQALWLGIQVGLWGVEEETTTSASDRRRREQEQPVAQQHDHHHLAEQSSNKGSSWFIAPEANAGAATPETRLDSCPSSPATKIDDSRETERTPSDPEEGKHGSSIEADSSYLE